MYATYNAIEFLSDFQHLKDFYEQGRFSWVVFRSLCGSFEARA